MSPTPTQVPRLSVTSREVEFYFQDIQLLDSVNKEPESHGLVSYRIRPSEGIPLLTELNNTVHIFFDNDPPIVTNTTRSTTYDCSLFEISVVDEGALLTASEGDSYQWFLNGDTIPGATEQEYVVEVNGSYAVAVSSGFPCSGITNAVSIIVDALDENSVRPIRIFPNPITESAIIDLSGLRGKAQLLVYDATGRVVRSEQVNLDSGVLTLQRDGLEAGRYELELRMDEERSVIPFVVE